MADLNGFDATNVEPNAGFDPIPAGKYVAAITASEMKPTKNGKGEYLELEMDVLEGPFKGRKLWDRLTLKHPNTQTVEIAKGTLSAICRAVNVLRPRDSVELHNLPLVVSVAIKNREDTGEPTNTIKGYAKRDTGVAPQIADGGRFGRDAAVEALTAAAADDGAFVVELPYPPSVNHYWRRVGDRTLISREGRKFRKRVCDRLERRTAEPMSGRVAVHVTAHPPDRRRRDLDNAMKALLDALGHGGVYEDDGQIDRLEIERGPVVPGGKVVVRVSVLPGERDDDRR